MRILEDELLRKSGIYKIVNLVNNNTYIGSAVKLYKRKNQHLHSLRRNIHHSTYLQNSFNKHKEENFKFEVVEFCEKEELLEREQYYIDTLNPVYNTLKIAGSMIGFKFTEKSIIKMKESSRLMSKEKREYIRECINKKVQKEILQYDLKGNLVREYKSYKEYEDITGRRETNVLLVCKGKRKTSKGFIYKYKTNG